MPSDLVREQTHPLPRGGTDFIAFEQLKPAEVILCGSTPLIHVGQLAQNETCNISLNPLMVKTLANKTVFIERPIITWDEIKPITVDGVLGNFKDDYLVVLYVSELQFEDGARWEGTIE